MRKAYEIWYSDGTGKGLNLKPWGWYFWYCQPGCLPDSDPFGPFETEAEAIESAEREDQTMTTDEWRDMHTVYDHTIGNRRLAIAIREIDRLQKASWDNVTKGYGKDYMACIAEVVGDDPIATILSCLFTAGYSDMFDFCDTVLGKDEPSGVAANMEDNS